MRIEVITIFPKMFEAFLVESLIKRGIKKGLLEINVHDLRTFTHDKHRIVDDRPYGGGPGMLLKIEPIFKALKVIKKSKSHVLMLDPAGNPFDHKIAKRLAKTKQLILLCGRYEGFDARVRELVDERVSIGPYVLSGGELPAMVVIEAVSRFVPGVIGHKDALKEETHDDFKEYPQYTRPEIFRAGQKILTVPKVLLKGNHKKIKEWRKRKSQNGS